MDNRTPASSGGLLDAVRRLGDSLLAAAHDRVELLSLEVQEEKLRFIRLFVLLSAAVFAGVMAATFASLVLVYLFWDTARLAVLGGLAVTYAGALAVIVYRIRRDMTRTPPPFAGTLQELKQDRTCIPPPN